MKGMRRPFAADRHYHPPGYEGVDKEKWDKEKRDNYFNFTSPDCNFEPPPLKDGFDPVYLVIGQLTPAQYAQQLAIQQDTNRFGSAWNEFVFRHGVKDYKGFAVEDEGQGWRELRPEIQNGTYGPVLSQRSYEELSFFLEAIGEEVSLYIWRASRSS